MQPLSGNQRPDLLTSLINMSLVLRLPREIHLCRSLSNAPRLPSFLEMLQNPHVFLNFDKVRNPLRLPRKSTSERRKPPVPRSFLRFWLRNVLHATTACNFFISHLPSGLRTRRFSEPTFWPSGATNHWKNTVSRDFPTFSRTWIFFLWDFLFFDILSSSLPFADSSHLCFSSVHIVGSLTSKLPSNIRVLCTLSLYKYN